MSDLALTLFRLGFLLLLWVGVFSIVGVLSRDLKAPRDLRNVGSTVAATAPAANAKSAKRTKPKRGAPTKLVVTEGALEGTVVPLGSAPITRILARTGPSMSSCKNSTPLLVPRRTKK